MPAIISVWINELIATQHRKIREHKYSANNKITKQKKKQTIGKTHHQDLMPKKDRSHAALYPLVGCRIHSRLDHLYSSLYTPAENWNRNGVAQEPNQRIQILIIIPGFPTQGVQIWKVCLNTPNDAS